MTALLRDVWPGPVTLFGVVIAVVTGWRARFAVAEGVLEVYSPALRWGLMHVIPLDGGATAITLGHVVLARDQACLDRTRRHERVHVKQYEQWGIFFVGAYVNAIVWAFTRGRHPYFDNHFERAARAC